MRNTASWAWGLRTPTEYKAAARSLRALPAGSPPIVVPTRPKRAAVLEAVKATCGGPPKAASALTAPARGGPIVWRVGTKKRAAQIEQRNRGGRKYVKPFGHPLDNATPIQGIRLPPWVVTAKRTLGHG